MGLVFAGVHEDTGLDVAIKFARGDGSRSAEERFLEEVREHALLIHPGIVHLFDYGQTDGPIQVSASEELPARTPYVVMEQADRGSLREAMPFSDWNQVRQVLVEVLDALAHAHARAVIHRDIKPENLLLFSAPRLSQTHPRVKLADFGLARVFGHTDLADDPSLTKFAGTPNYMSPEQLRSHWQLYCPATDFYALGCTAWELVCGHAPFQGATVMGLAVQHCEAPRPELVPLFVVPEELESWIHKMMAIDPSQRFRRAVDALLALPGPSQNPEGLAIEPYQETLDVGESQWLTTLGVTQLPTEEWHGAHDVFDPGRTAPESSGVWAVLPPTERPVPLDWRAPDPTTPPAPLVGAGQGLFGLREIPFVGRDRERDQIWSRLRETRDTGDARIIILTGAAGVGKTRLAQWASIRAHEIAGAALLPVVHSSDGGGPRDGFAGLVQFLFHGWNLSRGEFYKLLAGQLPDDQSSALTELAYPLDEDGADQGPGFRFESPRHRYATLVQLFFQFISGRPCVSTLDDLHWSPDTLGFLEYMARECERPPPALILTCIRDEHLMRDQELARRVAALCEDPIVERMDLAPLTLEDQHALLEQLLPMEPKMVRLVVQMTQGNPVYARDVLADWIASGGILRSSMGKRGGRYT